MSAEAEKYLLEHYGNWQSFKPHLSRVGEIMQQYAEHYHQTQVKSITDEEIENESWILFPDNADEETRQDFQEGAEWFKQQLLNKAK